MSCIATLYTVSSSAEADFARAKANEKREVITKFLFFTRRKTVGEKYLWEFLDEVAEKRTELDYSGFFVVDYLFTYLQPGEGRFFQPVDDYCMKLPHEQAKELSAFLQANPPERGKLEQFWKDEHDGDVSDLQDIIDTLVDVHETIQKWAAEITEASFGVLYLSF